MPRDINYERIMSQRLRGVLICAAENVHLEYNWRAGLCSIFLFSGILKRNTLTSRWGTAFPLSCQSQSQLLKFCLHCNSRLFSSRHRLLLEGVASCHFSLSICFKQMKKKCIPVIGNFAVSTKPVLELVLYWVVSLLRPSGILGSPSLIIIHNKA